MASVDTAFSVLSFIGVILAFISLPWHLQCKSPSYSISSNSFTDNIIRSMEYRSMYVHGLVRSWMSHPLYQLRDVEGQRNQLGTCLV